MGKRLLVFCFLILVLAGCWDTVDIEKRGFVIGTALDVADSQNDDQINLSMTNQFVVPAGITAGNGGGGSMQKAYTNVTADGESIFEISRKMATLMGRAPFYEHLKVIVISEEVVKEPDLFASIMDVFIRDQEMRREIRVIISEGDAKNILEVEPETEKLPAMYINEIMENTYKALGLIDPVRMGDIHEFLLNHSTYVIPRVVLEGKRVQFSGAGVFRGEDNKFSGLLNDEETVGMNLIKHNNTGGYIKFEVDDRLMVYEVQNTKPTIKIDVKDEEKIDIKISIEAEGKIGEMFGSRSLLNEAYLSRIEKKVSEKIEEIAMTAINKGREDLNVDILGFDEELKQRHHETWKKLEDNWVRGDNLFGKSNITVSADAIVRTTGASDKAKDLGNE
ncbi:Ger(x)C family spore germination protein [Oceanobacillus picturae]|uniref:Ger(x)C family spore germination protein n=1 Tax=Oceanobacillus picturae TaxID=171693 RepID=UPI00364485C3